MIRKVIQIDEERCNGCGACASACHEGAIGIINGKAHLLREDYCDGLGDCLPECPMDAIKLVAREAAAYDEQAVLAHKANAFSGCPGTRAQAIRHGAPAAVNPQQHSELGQWPCQLRLVPVSAPYFQNADILIAADCTAYAYANVHAEFMRGRITLIGCPKLDAFDYASKIAEILQRNEIQSVTLLRMEVPCCGNLERAAKLAIQASGKAIPLRVQVISTDGRLI